MYLLEFMVVIIEPPLAISDSKNWIYMFWIFTTVITEMS